MTTATVQKQRIEPTWDKAKIQEEATALIARTWMNAFNVICRFDHKAAEEFERLNNEARIKNLTERGVKTPVDLVKAIAEFDANVFGSEIEIEGNDREAKIIFNQCGMWNAMQKAGTMTTEQEEKMGTHFQSCMSNVAKPFGFTAEACFGDKKGATVTFRKA